MSGMAVSGQQSIVSSVRLSVQAALDPLNSSASLQGAERRTLAGEVRESIIESRKKEGTIQDPAIWQEIHTMVNQLEERLAKYLQSN